MARSYTTGSRGGDRVRSDFGPGAEGRPGPNIRNPRMDDLERSDARVAKLKAVAKELADAKSALEAEVLARTGDTLKSYLFTLPNKRLPEDDKRVGNDEERKAKYMRGMFKSIYKTYEDAVAKDKNV